MSDTVQKDRNKKMGTAAPAKPARASKPAKTTGTIKSDRPRDTGKTAKSRIAAKAAAGVRASGKATNLKPPRTTKAAAVLALLRSKSGASIEEMVEATGWQAHSVRGFLSSTVKKKLGLVLESEKDKAGVRKYQIAAQDSASANADASPKRGSGKPGVNQTTPSS